MAILGIDSKENSFAPLILINGKEFRFQDAEGNYYYTEDDQGIRHNTVCNPAIGYNEQSEQLVQSTRNAKGQVVAHKINRRLNKFENLTWPYLSRYSVNWLKNEISKFECELSYWDDESNQWITRKYYWGDFSATPCKWETIRMISVSGTFYRKRPTWYKDIKCNLIDCGY